MTAESPDWPDIAHTYDVVAETYAATFAGELDRKPFDRDLLDRWAAAVAGRGPVWDIGCGPAGHVTRYLVDRDVDAVGVDLSRRVVEVARLRQPAIQFRTGDMCDLPATDGSLAGILAFYSLIHLRRQRIPLALAEFARVLAPGGSLLVAMHCGEGEATAEEWLGHAVEVRATLVEPDELAAAVERAGFRAIERHLRDPYDGEYPAQRIYVWGQLGGS